MPDGLIGPRFEHCSECGATNGDGYEELVHFPDCSLAPMPDTSPMPTNFAQSYQPPPRFAALRAALSAAEQENERLRTQISVGEKLHDTLMDQNADLIKALGRKASEVEALASGKVFHNIGNGRDYRWYIADPRFEPQSGFDTATEALDALLGPSPERKP